MRTPPATAPFVFLLIVCVFCGCQSDSPRGGRRPEPRMPVVSYLGPTEVEAELLRSQISSIRLDGLGEFRAPGMKSGGSRPTSLVFKRDGGRLELQLRIRRAMRGSLLKATTNGERVCICNYGEKVAYEGLDHGYHDTVGVMGVFPDDLAEFFHISGIIGTRPSIFETQALAYQIQLIDIGEGDDIKVFRRINVARSDLSVVGYEVFNPDGSRRAWIQAQDHREHQGVRVPYRIFAAWPSAQTSLSLIVSKVEMNCATEPEIFEPSVPSGVRSTQLRRPMVRRPRARLRHGGGVGRRSPIDWTTR